MQKLSLLFTKDGLQWAIGSGPSYSEKAFFQDEETPEHYISEQLTQALQQEDIGKIEIISAINHFSMLPFEFDQHHLGYQLISYNAPVDPANEELMIAINNEFNVQFYYTMPTSFYEKIKATKIPSAFNFSGEKFLNHALFKDSGQQIHIHLYHNQAEFFAIKNKQILLYNNLDAHSEVDFLYFIMFAASKLNFNFKSVQFLVYGEIEENETFLGELQKFAPHVEIVEKNIKNEYNFILQ
ncbi:DUF3822 family protein [Elizabethkingia argentiflava]|uniref:DUF3822 family protein n=1 Tax=Elizabethkingia argenteiflava TaxID=2681556 RepID=A0A845PX76_9FLAO|nr:DUF3822 family protein [Elizabethkingia argenteiflava]NAW51456.1 DUF3822 family protein [Elizabethkingia argenteiflava]